jgi:hypothetical protein
MEYEFRQKVETFIPVRVSPICTLLLLSSLFMACLPLAEQRHSFLLDLGELEYGMYTQRYFDFSVKIPENWSYEPPAEDQDYADGFRTQALMITDSLPEADQRLWLGQLKGQGQARLGMRADYLQPGCEDLRMSTLGLSAQPKGR